MFRSLLIGAVIVGGAAIYGLTQLHDMDADTDEAETPEPPRVLKTHQVKETLRAWEKSPPRRDSLPPVVVHDIDRRIRNRQMYEGCRYTNTTRLVLETLARVMDKRTNEYKSSQRVFAHECKISVNTLKRHIKLLEADMGLICVKRGKVSNTRNDENVYSLGDALGCLLWGVGESTESARVSINDDLIANDGLEKNPLKTPTYKIPSSFAGLRPFFTDFDLSRWIDRYGETRVIEVCESAKHKKHPAGYAQKLLTNNWTLKENKKTPKRPALPRDEYGFEDGRRFISGEYADFIDH